MVKDAKEFPKLATLRSEVGPERAVTGLPQSGEKKLGGEAPLINGFDHQSTVGAYVESRGYAEVYLLEVR